MTTRTVTKVIVSCDNCHKDLEDDETESATLFATLQTAREVVADLAGERWGPWRMGQGEAALCPDCRPKCPECGQFTDEGWPDECDAQAVPIVAVKRTPEAWCAEYGIRILDPDGWRGKNDPPWTEPLTLVEFYDRAVQCTASADWTRIANDVKAAAS